MWKNPYLETVDPEVDKCAPLAFGSLSGGLNEGIVFDEVLDAYVMVGMSNSAAGGEWGVYYSTSTDLVEWTPRRLLVELAINPTVDDPDNDTVHAYPTIIDPDSPSVSFSTTDGQMYLDVSRFNFGGNSLDRDLLRIPIEVREVELTAPDWSFDVDGDAEGWAPEQDIVDLAVAVGAMSLRTTGDDAVLISPPLRVPAAFDTVRIRMSATGGPEDAAAELFFLTDTDPNYDGEKLVVFDVIDDGEFHECVVEFADVAGWEGIITRLRFDLITQPGRDIVVDRIWFTDS